MSYKICGTGGVAQLGERVVRNDEVGSSILLLSTTAQIPSLSWKGSAVWPQTDTALFIDPVPSREAFLAV